MNWQSCALLAVVVIAAAIALWRCRKRPHNCGCSDGCTGCALKEKCCEPRHEQPHP